MQISTVPFLRCANCTGTSAYLLVYNIPAHLNLVFYKLGDEVSFVTWPLACSAAAYLAAWRSFLRR